MNNIFKRGNCDNPDAREMAFGLLAGGEDGEYTGVDFVEISKIFAMGYAYYFVTETFDKPLKTMYRTASERGSSSTYLRLQWNLLSH